jgi:hypothetical protein
MLSGYQDTSAVRGMRADGEATARHSLLIFDKAHLIFVERQPDSPAHHDRQKARGYSRYADE